MQRIEVAVGIVTNQAGEVLLGQRTVQDRYFKKWEFPGGKIEPNENPMQALQRELHEELGISVLDCQPLVTIEHDYPDRRVRLFVRRVKSFSGSPQGIEGQNLIWVALDRLSKLDLLAGNQAIVDCLSND